MKKETSVVAAVAPSGHSGIGAQGNPDPREDKKRQKIKRKMMSKGKQKNQPKEFKTLESKSFKEHVNEVTRDVIYELILEDEDPQNRLESVLRVYDNLTNQIQLSMKYSRVFIADGLKLDGDDGIKFNLKRAKAELDRVKKLADDLNALLSKIYQTSKQEEQMKKQREEAVVRGNMHEAKYAKVGSLFANKKNPNEVVKVTEVEKSPRGLSSSFVKFKLNGKEKTLGWKSFFAKYEKEEN